MPIQFVEYAKSGHGSMRMGVFIKLWHEIDHVGKQCNIVMPLLQETI